MLLSPKTYFFRIFCFLFIISLFSCKKRKTFISPDGYNFAQPEKYFLGELLYEISGIAFLHEDDTMVYAINDEEGRVYYFNPDKKNYKFSRFDKGGDYEDLAIVNDKHVAVLKSDGTIYFFPLSEVGQKKMELVSVFKKLLPKGEYEGMCAIGDTIFVLCKNCPGDKNESQVTIFAINDLQDSTVKVSNSIVVDLSSLLVGKKNKKFSPSCIAKNPVTNEWYIISSVNKMLLVLDVSWKVKANYTLDLTLFKHPEGIAFNKNGDLFVSNEGGITSANILKFTFNTPH